MLASSSPKLALASSPLLDSLLPTAIWIVVAYLVAAIPVGYVIGRIRGIDLREIGSGNIGATNTARALGRKWGFVVFLLDAFKGWLPTWLAAQNLDTKGVFSDSGLESLPLVLVAAAAFLGHLYPVYLRFRGGKGVAVAFGAYTVFSPAAGAVALYLYLQTWYLTRVGAIGSLTGVATMMLFFVTAPSDEQAIEIKLSIVVIAAMIFWRHRENLRDLRNANAAKTSK